MYKPQIDSIEVIADNIIRAGVVIQNVIPMYSELVEADVKVNKALADLEWLCDTKRCEVSTRAENTGKPSVYIKVLYLNETINERQLITICKGHLTTLKSLIYRASK